MLDKIAYLGHELTSVDFKVYIDSPDGKGYYNYSVQLDESVSLTPDDASESVDITFSVESKNDGFMSGETEDPKVFSLKFNFDILFRTEKGMSISSDFLEENQWYFENFAHVASKQILSDITEHTSFLKKNFIPSHRLAHELE